jgi:site-specific recombinase XerD
MNPLRQQMIDLMSFRNYSPRTHQTYLGHVKNLALYYHRSPEEITEEEVEQWLMFLFLKKKLAPASVMQAFNALKFLYSQVLKKEDFLLKITLPKREQKIPDLLSPKEVKQIINASKNRKVYAMLSLCYGCGLGLSEVTGVQVNHIDSKNQRLKIVQGKGKKDRMVPMTSGVINVLREYWKYYRSPDFLFYGSRDEDRLSDSTLQKSYTTTKKQAGVTKKGGIHALRHAYATHQIDAGMPIHQLKDILGHTDIRTTMRYLHWCPKTSSENFDLLQNWDGFKGKSKQEPS